MTHLDYIPLLLILLLYVKWILYILFLPIAIMARSYLQAKDPSFITKILFVPYYILERILNFGGMRWFLYVTSTVPSMHWRKNVYKLLGAQIQKNVVIHYGTEIRSVHTLKIGEGTIVGDKALLDARNGISIGSNVNISSNVSIYTDEHNYKAPDFRSYTVAERRMDVKLEDRVWIGANVIVLPGVTIGEGAVCCAGCVVTKDVAPFSVVAGVPAKKIANRPESIHYVFDGSCNRLL